MTVSAPCIQKRPRTGTGALGARARGMTVLELTVVLLVLLSLTGLLMVSGLAWKRGVERALCIVNLEHVQRGVRGYANLNDLEPGDFVLDLDQKVIGSDKLVQGMPECPGGGQYFILGNDIPKVGQLYATCSLSVDRGHQPDDFSGW